MQLVVDGGIIKDCIAYSDALDTELFEHVSMNLMGSTFTADAMEDALRKIVIESDKRHMLEDVILLIREKSK